MSRKRECPSCAGQIPADQDRCFICGYEFAGKPGGRSWRAWVAIILLVIFLYPLLRFIVGLLRGQSE